MLAAILKALMGAMGPIGAFIAALLKALGPPVVVTEAEKAGAAQRQIQDLEAADADVSMARAAGQVVARAAAADPASLRAPDPDSRD